MSRSWKLQILAMVEHFDSPLHLHGRPIRTSRVHSTGAIGPHADEMKSAIATALKTDPDPMVLFPRDVAFEACRSEIWFIEIVGQTLG